MMERSAAPGSGGARGRFLETCRGGRGGMSGAAVVACGGMRVAADGGWTGSSVSPADASHRGNRHTRTIVRTAPVQVHAAQHVPQAILLIRRFLAPQICPFPVPPGTRTPRRCVPVRHAIAAHERSQRGHRRCGTRCGSGAADGNESCPAPGDGGRGGSSSIEALSGAVDHWKWMKPAGPFARPAHGALDAAHVFAKLIA
jgi:hypothetical protein